MKASETTKQRGIALGAWCDRCYKTWGTHGSSHPHRIYNNMGGLICQGFSSTRKGIRCTCSKAERARGKTA